MATSESTVEIDFDTADEAIATYRGEDADDSGDDDGDGNSNGEDTPGEADWGEMQEAEHNFIGGWKLLYQPNLEEQGVRRWFVLRVTNAGQLQALNMSGVAKDFPKDASAEELPHTRDRAEAEAAYETWLENADPEDVDKGGPGEDDEDGSGDNENNWTEWKQIEQEAGWYIFRRQHKYESAQEFFAAGENAKGETVFLGPEGKIQQEEHIFEYLEDVYAAIEAYVEDMDNKPAEDRPTGAPPGQGNLPGQSPSAPGSNLPVVGPAAQAVGGIGNLLLIVAAVLVIGYYLESQGHIDLTDRFGPEGEST